MLAFPITTAWVLDKERHLEDSASFSAPLSLYTLFRAVIGSFPPITSILLKNINKFIFACSSVLFVLILRLF